MVQLLSVGETRRENVKKPVKMGLDFIRDQYHQPITRTRRGAYSMAEKRAKKQNPKNFWHVDIADCGEYYRISLCGQWAN